jgi:hypothetical protein
MFTTPEGRDPMVQVLFATYHLSSLRPSKLFDNAHIVPCTMKSKLKIRSHLAARAVGLGRVTIQRLQKRTWQSSEFKDGRSSWRTSAAPLLVNPLVRSRSVGRRIHTGMTTSALYSS